MDKMPEVHIEISDGGNVCARGFRGRFTGGSGKSRVSGRPAGGDNGEGSESQGAHLGIGVQDRGHDVRVVGAEAVDIHACELFVEASLEHEDPGGDGGTKGPGGIRGRLVEEVADGGVFKVDQDRAMAPAQDLKEGEEFLGEAEIGDGSQPDDDGTLVEVFQDFGADDVEIGLGGGDTELR